MWCAPVPAPSTNATHSDRAQGWMNAISIGTLRQAIAKTQEEATMAKGQVKSNKEARKPKKEKPKTNASAPSMKGTPGKG